MASASDKISRRIELARRRNAKSLSLEGGTGKLPSLTGLEKLERLNLRWSHFNNLESISELVSLKELYLPTGQIVDLHCLRSLTQLRVISGHDTIVSDIRPLSNLSKLRTLFLSGAPIKSIAPLSGLTELRTLGLENTAVKDLSALSGMKNLKTVSLSGMRLRSLAPLATLPNLTRLDLDGCEVRDYSPIAELAALQWVDVSRSSFSDLRYISRLSDLWGLRLEGTGVDNLAPLMSLGNLTRIFAAETYISDLAPLSNLRGLEALDISSTPVADLTPILDLTTLSDGAMDGKYLGLNFKGAPVSDPTLLAMSTLDNPNRTVETINYLRRQAKLPDYVPPGYTPIFSENDGAVGDVPPAVPPQRPAAVEPIWQTDGRLGLPRTALASDLDDETIDSALGALKGSLSELANDADAAGNIDRRATDYLRRLAHRIPDRPPAQAELFRIAHVEELLRTYGTTVNREWPDFLASSYHALTLQFSRTMRQFPRWREFKRNAEKDQLSGNQIENIVASASEFVALLEEEEAQQFIDPILPGALEELGEPIVPDTEAIGSDVIDKGVELLAEDLLESIDNTLKALAEAALFALAPLGRGVQGYADGVGRGFQSEAVAQGKKDGQRLFKWVRRLLVTGGLAGVAWLTGLLNAFPSKFSWLASLIEYLSKLTG